MKQIQVMLAEDFQLLREDLTELIDAQPDMRVAGAAQSGREAVELVRAARCDVFLMDIEMETMNAGIEAAEQILQLCPEVKIVFLTAHEADDMITAAMGSGAVDYFIKGDDEAHLLRHIRRASEGVTQLHSKIHRTVLREYQRLRRSEQSLIFFINNVGRLTPAERELVGLLMQGKTVAEMAKLRCVEVVTVKTQMKGLLQKFGCARGKQIVQLIRQMQLEHLF